MDKKSEKIDSAADSQQRRSYGKKKKENNLLPLVGVLLLGCLGIGGLGIYQRMQMNQPLEVPETIAVDPRIESAEAENTAESTEMTQAETLVVPETITTSKETEAMTEAEEETVIETEEAVVEVPEYEAVYWNDDWTYAENSKVHQESVNLYHSQEAYRNGIVVAINAGHGSSSAAQVSTLCHPDGSAKVTGGSTGAGATTATGANGGMTFSDGSSEASVNLSLALTVKDQLLQRGYDVLMLREDSDCNLDNIARTLYANNYADCHIALHYDSTESDKGLFFIGVPDISSYRNMEPVASHWEEHEALGWALVSGADSVGMKIYSDGRMALDLTQTSYSTIPSIDLEVGDRVSDHSQDELARVAEGICNGIETFFIRE